MDFSLIRWRSLKTRVTLFTLAIFLAGTWALVIYVSGALRNDMERLLARQQFSFVSFMAADADRELNERLLSLGRTAGLLSPKEIHDPAALASFLEERPVLVVQFNAGVSVVGTDGKIIAGTLGSGRLGLSYAGLDTVDAALKEGRSTIGQPVRDQTLDTPMFSMAVPIRGETSEVIGALVGFTDLSRESFLDQITGRYYGRTGYFLLVSEASRMVVSTTGRERVLTPLSPPGSNALFARFAEGFDETGIAIDVTGAEIMASARRVPSARWFIVAALPAGEAFEAIRDMRHLMFGSALVLTILAAALTSWMLRRELEPMLTAISTLTTLSTRDEPPLPLPVPRSYEIGRLIEGFNRLLETLAQRERALRESEARFRALDDASFGGIAIHDRGRIVDCNRGLSTLTGYPIEELIGMDVFDLLTPESRESFADYVESRIDHRRHDALGVRKDGTRFHLSLSSKDIPYRGQVLRVFEFRDITERKQMEELVRQQALHDSLTQLPNRRLLADRLGQAMAASKRSGTYGALLFLDLDNFKPLNDMHGHEVGDLLLVEAASRLRSCVRESDTVARFGGDEFVVVLTSLAANEAASVLQAEAVAEKIRAVLGEPYRLKVGRNGKVDVIVKHRCTASIGIALFHDLDVSQDEVLKRADTAMYEAKDAGANEIRFHRPPDGGAQVQA